MFSIIIPIKNQFEIVKQCLDSILRHCYEQEVILVDDGSDEEETIRLLRDYSKIYKWKLIRNEKSVNHSVACEMGIEKSSNQNLFLLNSDTIITKNSLQILSDVLDKNIDIAVVGPSTSSASGEQQIEQLFLKRFEMTIQEIDEIAISLLDNNQIKDIKLVNGFCFGIKKTIFQNVRGFDSNLNCYGNEQELLIRIRKEKYRTVHVCNSYVHHLGKMSFKSNLNIGVAIRDASKYILKKHGVLN